MPGGGFAAFADSSLSLTRGETRTAIGLQLRTLRLKLHTVGYTY